MTKRSRTKRSKRSKRSKRYQKKYKRYSYQKGSRKKTNRLAMVNKRSNSTKKSSKKFKGIKGIIDVPLAKTLSEGTKASLGSIDYHYQKYYNTFAFLEELIKKFPQINNTVCIPNVGSEWMKSFLKVHFFKDIGELKPHMESIKPVDMNVSSDKFMTEVHKCIEDSRLVPISLEIIVPDVGTHANMILIDSHKKTVELFEPHGNRDNDSELEDISRAYTKVSTNVQKFFRKFLSDYTYIPPSKYEPKRGLQERLDAFSGLCVTWSILYMHYRILNPDIDPKKLVLYMDGKVNKQFLLRYTKFVEDTLKHK